MLMLSTCTHRGWDYSRQHSRYRGQVCLANVMFRHFQAALVFPYSLFNYLVLEPGTGTHPRVGTLTLEHNVVRCGLRLVNKAQISSSLHYSASKRAGS